MVPRQQVRPSQCFPPPPLPHLLPYPLRQAITVFLPAALKTDLEGFPVTSVTLQVIPLSPKHHYRVLQHQTCLPCHARAVLAVFENHLVVPVDRKHFRDAKVEVVILGSFKRSIESTNGLYNAAPVHHRSGNTEVYALQKRGIKIAPYRLGRPGFGPEQSV